MVYPNPQIYDHLKAIFVHVPKTAGTAIERALRESPRQNVGGHTTALGFRAKFPDEFSTYFKFAVVRHPVSRFLSAYRYLRGENVHPAHHNAEIHECDTFAKWWELVRRHPERLDQIVHFHPQHRFVCDRDGAVLVDRICHYETITEEWERVCLDLGVQPQTLPRVNSSKLGEELDDSEGALAEWIAEIYVEDFALGGYESVRQTSKA